MMNAWRKYGITVCIAIIIACAALVLLNRARTFDPMSNGGISSTGVIATGSVPVTFYEDNRSKTLTSIDWGTVVPEKSKHHLVWLYAPDATNGTVIISWTDDAASFLVEKIYFEYQSAWYNWAKGTQKSFPVSGWLRVDVVLTASLGAPEGVFSFNIIFNTS